MTDQVHKTEGLIFLLAKLIVSESMREEIRDFKRVDNIFMLQKDGLAFNEMYFTLGLIKSSL